LTGKTKLNEGAIAYEIKDFWTKEQGPLTEKIKRAGIYYPWFFDTDNF